jgi:type II secretory pathway pseudopilin PulG
MVQQQTGISLIEILIAIALIGVMAMLVVPRFARRGMSEREHILQEINLLLRTAHTNAILTGSVHKVIFNIKDSSISLQQEKEGNFIPVKISYLPITTWDSSYKLTHFIVKGKDEIREGEGVSTSQAWFFIMPDGFAQEVTLTFNNAETHETFSFILNPFTAQLRDVE